MTKTKKKPAAPRADNDAKMPFLAFAKGSIGIIAIYAATCRNINYFIFKAE